MPSEFYEEQEAEAILRLAAHRDIAGSMSRDQLFKTAAELGISPEAVLEAEIQIRTQHERTALQKEFQVRQKRQFIEQLSSYALMNAFFVAIWIYTGRAGSFWPAIPIVICVLKLVGNAGPLLNPKNLDYQSAFEKWLKKKSKAPRPE